MNNPQDRTPEDREDAVIEMAETNSRLHFGEASYLEQTADELEGIAEDLDGLVENGAWSRARELIEPARKRLDQIRGLEAKARLRLHELELGLYGPVLNPPEPSDE